MTKYYVDTAIWRDFYENRNDKFRPLGEWAFEFFRMIREDGHFVLFSDLVINELSRYFTEAQIDDMMDVLSKTSLLIEVRNTELHQKEAIRISKKLGVHPADCLHAILARDNDAVMITRDRHFEEFQSIVAVQKPEDLI